MSTPQTATETLEAYKALGENIDIIAGAYEQALVALKAAQELSSERLNAIDDLRAILTEVRAERDAAVVDRDKARTDLSAALQVMAGRLTTTPGPCSDVREAPQEPEFLPGDLARASTDTSPSSDFWPPIGRVDGSIVWLHYARGDVQCKKVMLVRKPVISGDYVRVWRGPAQGFRGRVDSYDPNNGALRINGTDWVNRADVVAVKP